MQLRYRYLAAALATATGWALLSQPSPAAEDGLTVHDVARLQNVTSAAVSPDGEKIAYTLSVPRKPMDDENGPAWSQLHVVDLQGNTRPFVSGQASVSNVQWTPDGSGISFLAKRGDDKHTSLYLIAVDGGEARRLAAHGASISDYSWRPDGKQVAFLAAEADDAERQKLKDKGFNAEIYEEQLKDIKVWLVDADPESNDAPQQLATQGSASELHFSPSGERLVVALADDASVDRHYMYRRLHVIDARSGETTASIANPGKLGPVRWSPNGQYLALASGEDINDPSEGRLMIASASGGVPREIMPEYLPNISGLEWKNDETILFTADDGCLTACGQVNADGSNQQFRIRPGGPILTGMSLSDDRSTAVFAGSTPQHPAEVFVVQDGAESARRLTDSNPWLGDKRLAEQQIVKYRARDGEMVEGILVRPLDEQPGKRYPLILTVHGGPEAHVPNGWVTSYSNPGQVGAARGFAVFYPNYRGSTGRGVAFAKAHQSDYGGREFNDLIDGVDHLIEMGLVDKDKVGVTGGSYGGFATAWCSTYHSDRFSAGVMFVGISNQISKSGTTDIPEEMYLVHARKRVWDDWQFFLERSPIFHVEKCKTPLLILHGKNDTRVHPSQSMELYRNLKILGQAPVRLVFYPGEGHGNRNAAGRLDYNMRLLQWMEHYLQGPGGDPPPLELDYDLPKANEEAQEARETGVGR